jgi:hypothetical protein
VSAVFDSLKADTFEINFLSGHTFSTIDRKDDSQILEFVKVLPSFANISSTHYPHEQLMHYNTFIT